MVAWCHDQTTPIRFVVDIYTNFTDMRKSNIVQNLFSHTLSVIINKLHSIVVAIQDLLDSPNTESPANSVASQLLKKSAKQYSAKIVEQAKKFAEVNDEIEIL